jgi:ribose 1,5-bisphosphokinase
MTRLMSGWLVLVVGPSGAGKDTMLRYAQARLGRERGIVFVRRAITRPAEESEDHEPLTLSAFLDRRFALSWAAHGLHYGIPASIEPALASGGIVIANVSRSVLAQAARKFRCLVVEVTAPPDVLAARLAARGRENAGDIALRLARAQPDFYADAVIVNDTTPEAAGEAFLAVLAKLR